MVAFREFRPQSSGKWDGGKWKLGAVSRELIRRGVMTHKNDLYTAIISRDPRRSGSAAMGWGLGRATE